MYVCMYVCMAPYQITTNIYALCKFKTANTVNRKLTRYTVPLGCYFNLFVLLAMKSVKYE